MNEKDVMKMKIGDYAMCIVSGVMGEVVNIYTPTASEQQIMVCTPEGRLYHAPYSMWVKVSDKV